MTDKSALPLLAEYSRDLLGYSEVEFGGAELKINIPETATLAGRAAGSTITVTKDDEAQSTSRSTWLIEHILEHCPAVYKARLAAKKRRELPAEWQKAADGAGQFFFVWWNVAIRAVNIDEQLWLLPFWLPEGKEPVLLPVISAEAEEELLENLSEGAAFPAFGAETLAKVQELVADYFKKALAEKVNAATLAMEEERKRQLLQIDTYYFLTSKRIAERAVADTARQRWQLEGLAHYKAGLLRQIDKRYSAESVFIHISPEVVVLCGGNQ